MSDDSETVADSFEKTAGDRSGEQDIDAEVRHPADVAEVRDAGDKVRDKADRLRETIDVD